MRRTQGNGVLTANSLKNALWDTLTEVRGGQRPPAEADAIASQAREIIRLTRLQLSIAGSAKRDVPADVIDFSETD